MFKQFLKVASISMTTSLALAVNAHTTQALDFTFSFDNSIGNTSGTVSGIIQGLNDNNTGAASAVIVTDVPIDLEGSFNNGNNAVAWDTQYSNSFTVTNGVITSGNFEARDIGFGFDTLCLNATGANCVPNANLFTYDSNTTRVYNNDGFAGVTFAPVAVPFGVSPNMGLIILGGIWSISRLRKTVGKSEPVSKT